MHASRHAIATRSLPSWSNPFAASPERHRRSRDRVRARQLESAVRVDPTRRPGQRAVEHFDDGAVDRPPHSIGDLTTNPGLITDGPNDSASGDGDSAAARTRHTHQTSPALPLRSRLSI